MKIIKIRDCSGCPSFDHRGGFGNPANIPCCRKQNKNLNYSVAPSQRNKSHLIANYDGVIPDWCPLDDASSADSYYVSLLEAQVAYFRESVRKLARPENPECFYADFQSVVEYVNVNFTRDDSHDWVCTSHGEYDSTYMCKKCSSIHVESIDNPDSACPKGGCNG